MARRLWDTGSTVQEGRAIRKVRPEGYGPSVSSERTGYVEDREYADCPAVYTDKNIDFDGALATFAIEIPLFDDAAEANEITVGAADVARGSTMIRRAGYLQSVQLTAEDALAKHADNFLTFTLTNNGQDGSGSTEMLSTTTGANTTDNDLASAVAITAETGRAFTVSGTAANLRVAAGDLLTFAATVSGTLANEVHSPKVRLVFATLPYDLVPRTVKTVGLLAAQPVANSAFGEAIFQLGATDEANVTGFDLGDQLCVPAFSQSSSSDNVSGSGPWIEARVKISAIGVTGVRFVFGFCSAFNSTLDSTTQNFWFKLEGASLALLYETDDNTTNEDDKAVGFTLTAGTYYTLRVDLTEPGRAKFCVDNKVWKTVDAGALTSAMLLQPACYLQKDASLGSSEVQSITVDRVRWGGSRF